MNPYKQHRIYVTLGLFSLFVAVFSVSRAIVIGRIIPLYLVWNALLGWLPLLWAHLFIRASAQSTQRFFAVMFFVLWLLFLPNAFYILTDFVHLYEQSYVPVWYDIAEIFSYTFVGFMTGYLSLWSIEQFVIRVRGTRVAQVVSVATLLLSAIGVVIGRFLRWNSWDIFVSPGAFFGNVGAVFVSGGSAQMLVSIALIFAAIFIGIYWVFKTLVE